ncbi:MAG TPA: PAS domain S-box protein [Longimicrobiales bacterium]|nr:PAS domain S-box protein [Longimicrobiales bacterium]
MATRRILIVHDDDVAAAALQATLRRLGYEVAGTTASGGAALTLAASTEPDIVLMRMLLRGELNGGVAATAIRQHLDIPIVFIGTDADSANVTDTGPEEPYGYVVAGCSDRELHAHLELALCRHDRVTTLHQLEGFFDISQDLFCFLDFNGHFRRLNPAWETTLGFTREELMSRPFIEFVHPDDRERTLKQNAAVRGGGRAVHFENRYLCSDGSYRWLLWNAAPRLIERVIYSVARDITARKELEIERARLVGELEASLAEVKTLRDILPICLYCRKIRDDRDYWLTVEHYIAEHTTTRFSHGICPSCMETEVEPQLTEFEGG